MITRVLILLVIYVIGVIYARFVNKVLYKDGGFEIMTGFWFIPILAPVGMSLIYLVENGEDLTLKLKDRFKFLADFSGDNW